MSSLLSASRCTIPSVFRLLIQMIMVAHALHRAESGGLAMNEIFAQQADTSRGNSTFHIHLPLLAAALLVIGLFLHLAGRHDEARFPFHELFCLPLVAGG